jgi:hypothetical protein
MDWRLLRTVLIVAIIITAWLLYRQHQTNHASSHSYTVDSASHGRGGFVAEAGGGNQPEVDFLIQNIRQNQNLSTTAPYVVPGGNWTFFDCTLTSDPLAVFTFGFEKPGKSDEFASFSQATMFVPNRNAGARVAAAFGQAFRTDVPTPIEPEPLLPTTFTLADFGGNLSENLTQSPGGNWTATKLFLQEPGLDAEVFFNFDLVDGLGKFAEKDEDYRSDILYFVAEHFRDGPRPKRTPDDDPNVVRDGPSVRMLGVIGQSADCRFGFVPGGESIWVATNNPGGDLRLIRLGDLVTRIELGNFQGVVTAHPLDRQGDRLIVDEQIPTTPHAWSSDDEHRIWLDDRTTGKMSALTGPWTKTAHVDSVSNDGRFVSVSCWKPGTNAAGKSVNTQIRYIVDLVQPHISESEIEGTVLGWYGSGDSTRMVISKWSFDKGVLPAL